ncbi:MAG: peroxide stress protein YaaA [Rhodospirillaceae bacterium]|jgi:hypothetical protein|nr:peroxide stress protein YaaA [Rhodospirillaceae bacterium]MBT5751212.1 peroxide stress protein YaaA [Rhodospirillaceae bacterium]
MLILISPAKKLDFSTATGVISHSQPDFIENAQILAERARKLTRGDLSRLMKISDKLADLNYDRFKNFSPPFTTENAKQAGFAFSGDTYKGLDFPSLAKDDMEFAQKHLRILSGLYGLLRPLDLIQPYRLEMGSRFSNPRGENLYDFWRSDITAAVNKAAAKHSDKTVINLASQEYISSLDKKSLNGPFLTPVFKEIKNGKARIIGLMAKRARGMMARYIIEKRLEKPEALKRFRDGGYAYQEDQSTPEAWVFTRNAG